MKTRRTDNITRHDVASAASACGRRQYDLYDDSCDGLLIRVAAKSVGWYVRGRLGPTQKFWKIKDLDRGDDPKEMRTRATEARNLAKRGIDPKQRLTEQALGGQIERHHDPEKDGWDWETARDRYLTVVKQEKAPATYADYRKTLNGKDLAVWSGRLVKNLTKQDVQALQTSIQARGVKTQAAHTTRIIKACLSWVASTGISGLTESPALSVKPVTKTKHEIAVGAGFAARVPSADEIGDLLWRMDRSAKNSAARIAAALAMLTSQRRETIVSARRNDFLPVHDGAVWTIPAVHMKSKRPHVIPLPPFTWGLVRLALMLRRADSPWLFPQLRLRRRGDSGDGHMAGKEVAEAMEAAGSTIRPHACRRAFATYGESLLGFGRSDVKAILDHAEGQSGDVTAQHYALHDGTHFKWSVMRRWESWVLEQVRRRRPAGQEGELPAFISSLSS